MNTTTPEPGPQPEAGPGATPRATPGAGVGGPVARAFWERRAAAAASRDASAARAGRVSNARLVVFALGIGALVWAELEPARGGLALGAVAVLAVAFVALVAVQSRLTQAERRAAEMVAVNEEALARLRREWDGLPRVAEASSDGHAYARDLDVFGHASLARFLAATGTGPGRRRLHEWLLAPASRGEVGARQAAVRELVDQLEYRQELQVAGRLAGDPDPETLAGFLDWAESGPWLLRRRALLWAARLVPAATITLGVLQLEGTVARPWWILTLVAGSLMAWAFGRRVRRLMAGASLGDASLRRYADVVALIQDHEATSPALAAIRDALTRDADARAELERLGWLTELADLRHSGVFYVVVNLPTLWDFHVLAALERWKGRAGGRVRGWVDAIARADALAALAGPPHDEPGWSFPELTGGGAGPDDRLTAEALAHPLLPPDERVANDVTVGPPGSFLMVTGSNMSGKSTLLRAIGVNTALALAGGPVCAARMRLPPVELRTSMRVEDSLERGISLFMAELQRLKRVVDAADALHGGATPGTAESGDASEPRPPLLYLFDEVLHGTNSAERQVAIRKVLAHLLDRPAIGAISTHDLALADTEPLADAVVPVHFRETVHPDGHEPPMTFDYRLRPGVATSTNALKLVRLVGL